MTFGQRKTDNNNLMITIRERVRRLHQLKSLLLGQVKMGKFDHNNQMITLSVITLSGFHCIRFFNETIINTKNFR
jgi:hypothetical protein